MFCFTLLFYLNVFNDSTAAPNKTMKNHKSGPTVVVELLIG